MANILHNICVLAVQNMVDEGITRHVSYISDEDPIDFELPAKGRIPKVTIEWVDASETEPQEAADVSLRVTGK